MIFCLQDSRCHDHKRHKQNPICDLPGDAHFHSPEQLRQTRPKNNLEAERVRSRNAREL